jgi:hypothetical protein
MRSKAVLITLLLVLSSVFGAQSVMPLVSNASYSASNTLKVTPEYPYPWDEVNVTVNFTTQMISIVDFGEVIQDGNSFSVYISVVGTGYYYVETYTHTYHLGNLPVGSYEFIVYSSYDELDGSTTLFIVDLVIWDGIVDIFDIGIISANW